MIKLTADIHTAVKSLCNFRIHIDQKVLLLGKLLVAIGDLCLDPSAELFTNDGVGNVDEPLTWNLVHVTVFGKVVVDHGHLSGLLEYA